MVLLAEAQRCGMSDPDLLANVLATRKELAKDWKSDTCGRYLAVADKINAKCKLILTRWELMFQRNTLLDGITLLRAASTTCTNAGEFSELLETLFFEQVCKLRRSIAPKGRGHATDATNMLRGILLRNALYKYLRTIFPKLQTSISQYGTWQWFHSEYGMTETGNMPTELPGDSDDDPDEPAQGLCPDPEDASRYASKAKLVSFCRQVA